MDCPEASAPRLEFDKAFRPFIEASKLPTGLGSPAPNLYKIPPGSGVLIDPSVIMLAMDSQRAGGLDSRSKQASHLIGEVKSHRIRGFATPFVLADLWSRLNRAYSDKEYGDEKDPDPIPDDEWSLRAIQERLMAFCSGAMEVLAVGGSDMEAALKLSAELGIKPGMALSLSALQRVAGPEACVAAADPAYAPLLKAQSISLFAPSDIDGAVDQRWNSNLGLESIEVFGTV